MPFLLPNQQCQSTEWTVKQPVIYSLTEIETETEIYTFVLTETKTEITS